MLLIPALDHGSIDGNFTLCRLSETVGSSSATSACGKLHMRRLRCAALLIFLMHLSKMTWEWGLHAHWADGICNGQDPLNAGTYVCLRCLAACHEHNNCRHPRICSCCIDGTYKQRSDVCPSRISSLLGCSCTWRRFGMCQWQHSLVPRWVPQHCKDATGSCVMGPWAFQTFHMRPQSCR